MKITREALKTIVKETMIEESEYQEFFKRALEKAGGSIPKMSEEEKKAFFNKIEKTWKGKGEKNEISETELEEAQSPAQKAAFAKMLAKKDGKDESETELEEAQSPAQKAAFAKMLAKKDGKKKDEKEEVKESVVNERDLDRDYTKTAKERMADRKINLFATWEMSFADMNINGVELSSKKKYKVKARNTVEAIKKAASMAGLKGQDWVATQTNYLKKIG